MDTYLLSLCREYLELVEGYFSTQEDWQALSSERAALHDQIRQHLGRNISTSETLTLAKYLIHQARAQGHTREEEWK